MADGEDKGRQASSGHGAGYHIADPELMAKNMLKLFDQSAKVLTRILDDKKGSGPYSMVNEMTEASKALSAVANQWFNEPEKLAKAQTKLGQDFAELWTRSYQRMLGEKVEPVARPEAGDNRFQDPEWADNPYFDFWKQAYLLTSHWAEDMVENTTGVEERTRKRAEFYLDLMLAALSPSNFPLTNPEVMRTTLATNATNLVTGMTHLIEDLDAPGELMRIRQTDLKAFKVGENLAVTPGKVIFQNEIIQLIQYSPSTEKVFSLPLLIVPPWINKFYILDLAPQKSLVRWLVSQGFTVFMVSWVNPDRRLSHKTFEDYMLEGVVEAIDAVKKATDSEQINVLGYCVGGTLLAATLAYLAQTGRDSVRAAGFLTTQVDFAHAGDLLMFIDDAQLKELEEMMAERGFLDGSRMSAVFNMLRPRDLIWPYVVNNYLLGKQPFPFDLLYWNSDSTRMPSANHNFYLREFYHMNRLAKGEMPLGGVKLDLGKITLPIYELASREDHIAPAKSVLVGSKLFGGPVRFVVAASGHIAGVVNPPEKMKYKHWTPGDDNGVADVWSVDDWINSAQEHAGSWWPDFAQWLAGYSGDAVEPREPGAGPLKAIEDAPGAYVKA
jgi:polyhydroxyalkanoate synthase subunit PhaC